MPFWLLFKRLWFKLDKSWLSLTLILWIFLLIFLLLFLVWTISTILWFGEPLFLCIICSPEFLSFSSFILSFILILFIFLFDKELLFFEIIKFKLWFFFKILFLISSDDLLPFLSLLFIICLLLLISLLLLSTEVFSFLLLIYLLLFWLLLSNFSCLFLSDE